MSETGNNAETPHRKDKREIAPREQRRRRALGAALVLVCIGGAVIWRLVLSSNGARSGAPLPSAPPTLNLSQIAEPDLEVIQAIEQARSEVIRAPRSAVAWGRLGMILLAHDADADAANYCLAQAERLNPREFRWPYFQAISLLERDASSAIHKLTRAVELCGDDSDIPRVRLAETLMAQGQLPGAERHFDQLLRKDPTHVRATLGLARLASLKSDWQTARTCLAPIISQPLARKRIRTLSAEISYREGQRAEAARLLAEAAQLPDDPPWPDPLMKELEAMGVGRKHKLSRALELMRARRLTEAIRLLRHTLEQQPNSERTRLLLGVAYNMSRNWTAGEKVLRAAAAKSPAAPRVQFNLGASLFGQGRFPEAAECFEKAARGMPDDAMAHFYLGICRLRTADWSGAEAALRRALSCRPNLDSAHRELGELLHKQGHRDEAMEHLRIAHDLESRKKPSISDTGGDEAPLSTDP